MTSTAPAQAPASSPKTSSPHLHVLTLTPFYPTSADDAQGCFIAEPLSVTGTLGVKNTVIAARPFHKGKLTPPHDATDSHWKSFLTVPGNLGLASSGRFLFRSIASTIRQLHVVHPIDVIHAHAALPCGHAAALLGQELQIPFVVTVHGLDAFSTRQMLWYPGAWCKRTSKRVYESARRVICVSEKVRSQVLDGAPKACTSVVYNGVDTEQFTSGATPAVSPTILSIGNLIPTKRHELLLRAFAEVAPRHAAASVHIIGDGHERGRLQSLASKLHITERVRFLGRQSRGEVADAMQRCTLFALPSDYEGLGCVYLEAMSSAKAAIACRGQGIDEIIEHGHNGWLVPPNDVAALADSLRTLLREDDLRQRLGLAARETVANGFCLERQAERLIELYAECAA